MENAHFLNENFLFVYQVYEIFSIQFNENELVLFLDFKKERRKIPAWTIKITFEMLTSLNISIFSSFFTLLWKFCFWRVNLTAPFNISESSSTLLLKKENLFRLSLQARRTDFLVTSKSGSYQDCFLPNNHSKAVTSNDSFLFGCWVFLLLHPFLWCIVHHPGLQHQKMPVMNTSRATLMMYLSNNKWETCFWYFSKFIHFVIIPFLL